MKSKFTIGDITELFLEETGLDWDFEETAKLMDWYNDLDLIRVVSDSKGNLLSLVLGRRVHTLDEGLTYYVHDPEGPLLWIDFMSCRTGAAWGCLADFIEEMPDIKSIAFNRNLRNDPEKRLYKVEKFKNRLKGLKK